MSLAKELAFRVETLEREIRKLEDSREGWKQDYNKVVGVNIALVQDNEKLKKDLESYKLTNSNLAESIRSALVDRDEALKEASTLRNQRNCNSTNVAKDRQISNLVREINELQVRNDAQAQTITIAQEDWKKLQEMTECEVYGQPCSKRIADHFNSVWRKWNTCRSEENRSRELNIELTEKLSQMRMERNKYVSDFKDSEFVIKDLNARIVDYAEAILIYKNVTRSNLARIAALTEENEKLRAEPSTQTLANYSRRISDLEAIDSNLRDELYNVQKQSERKDEQLEFWHKKHQGLVFDLKNVLAK